MKHLFKLTLLFPIVLFTACNKNEQADTAKLQDAELIFPKGVKIESDNFTGDVWLEMIIRDDSALYTTMGNVTFEPGARTNWHLHPGGQILMITEGVGWYQERGKPKQEMRKGEVVTCQPDVEHWHGATADQSVTHMAMSINTQNGGAVWGVPVTDEEYLK